MFQGRSDVFGPLRIWLLENAAMSESSRNHPAGRRGFLAHLIAASGAGVATVAVVNRTTLNTSPAESVPAKPARGYQVTDHVRRYYAKARI
jgi:hypothetical protein